MIGALPILYLLNIILPPLLRSSSYLFLGILHENIPKDNMQKNKNFILKILVSKKYVFFISD